jgi:hypothetical protein
MKKKCPTCDELIPIDDKHGKCKVCVWFQRVTVLKSRAIEAGWTPDEEKDLVTFKGTYSDTHTYKLFVGPVVDFGSKHAKAKELIKAVRYILDHP